MSCILDMLFSVGWSCSATSPFGLNDVK